MKLKRLIVYTVADDRFLEGIITTLGSFRLIDKDFCNYELVCFYDNEISQLSQSSMKRLKSIFPQISIVPTEVEEFRSFPVVNVGHNVSLLRFGLFRERSDHDFILYLDSDLLILKDLSELFKAFQFSKCGILGVENLSMSNSFREYSFISYSMNTGIFLLKKDFINELVDRDFYSLLINLTNKKADNGGRHEMICQSILNEAFATLAYFYLSAPLFYNFRRLFDLRAHIDQVHIVHFVTRSFIDGIKPWEYNDKSNSNESFAYELWGNFNRKVNECYKI